MTRMAYRWVPSVGISPTAKALISPALVDVWRELRKGFLDSYRPELHYMRGPGPKWRQKNLP